MLGFTALADRPIAGAGYALIAVPALLSGSAAITFGAESTLGSAVSASANSSITFGANAEMLVNQALSGSANIAIGATAILHVAGKPIILRAVPQSYTIRAYR